MKEVVELMVKILRWIMEITKDTTELSMKEIRLYLGMLLVVILLAACNKDNVLGDDSSIGSLNIQVVATMDAFKGGASTRTYISNYGETANTILWGAQESLKIAVLGDGDVNKATWATKTTSDYDGQPSATFTFSVTPNEEKTGENYTYIGIYPASASIDESSVTEHKVSLKTIQDATAESYDPDAYILVAKPDGGHTPQNANWNASFRRATALNKITLRNLPEPIESVEIIVPDGKTLSGNRYIDLPSGVSGTIYDGKNTVTVNYSTPIVGSNTDGVNSKTIWFTSWGVELLEGESLTIIARSATRYYRRVITARSEGIIFKEGYLNTLGVNMASAEQIYKDYTFQLQSNSIIYENNDYAAFTSIIDYENRMFIAFREGPNHAPSSDEENGCIRVLENVSGEWNVIATIADATKDLRDPFLTIVDNHLRMYIMCNSFEGGEYHQAGTLYTDYINGNWSELRAVNHDLSHTGCFWRVRKYGDKYYSVAYCKQEYPTLMSSDDGINWTAVTEIQISNEYLNEADMCFIGDRMYVCIRKALPYTAPSYWCMADYPFTDFTWKEMEIHLESPALIRLPYSQTMLLSGRERDGTGTNANVSLFSVDVDGKLERITQLDGGFGSDRGYPGFLYKDGKLFLSYYTYTSGSTSWHISLATWNVE